VDDERYTRACDRLKPDHAERLAALLGEWVAAREEKEIIELGARHGFPVSPVMDDLQISTDAWRQERGNIVDFEDKMYGHLSIQTPSTKLSRTPARIKWLTRPLGYHNRYIFKRLLGLSEEQIQSLEKKRVVGYWDYRVGQRPPVYYDLDNDPIFHYREE